jgi:predicted phage tail protein
MTATASDPENQLARVEFLSGTTVLATDTAAPFTWSWSNVAAGTYTLSARAYDSAGAAATSAAVTVTVNGTNRAPTVALTSPASGATFTAPATISMTASASDPENQLARVEFLSGTTVLATDTTAPFAWSWSNVAAGSYTLTARAYDRSGASATSSAVTVTVGAVTTAPRLLVFTASADHATNVSSYRLSVYAPTANPATATPLTTSDLGKPTPDANNDITVDRATFFAALPVGNYVATVTAIGPGGQTQSSSVAFSR